VFSNEQCHDSNVWHIEKNTMQQLNGAMIWMPGFFTAWSTVGTFRFLWTFYCQVPWFTIMFPIKMSLSCHFLQIFQCPEFWLKKKTSHISREHIDQSWPHVMPRAPLAIASSQRSHQTRLAAQRPVQIAAMAIPSGLGCPMPWRSQTQWVYINPELYRLMTISQYLDISNLWW